MTAKPLRKRYAPIGWLAWLLGTTLLRRKANAKGRGLLLPLTGVVGVVLLALAAALVFTKRTRRSDPDLSAFAAERASAPESSGSAAKEL